MDNREPVSVIQAWEQAVNALDVTRALELSDADIEIVGPRGSAHGHDILKDWLSRAGLSLETRRSFLRGDDVVNEQQGVWRNLETGDLIDERAVASHYKTSRGQVTYVARYDDLETALAKAGLSRADEVS